MTFSKKKIPLIYLGIGLFLIVAICGLILELILKKDGYIAIPCVALGLLILSGFFVAETITRRRAEKQALDDEFGLPAPLTDEQRFLRHSDEREDYFADEPEPEPQPVIKPSGRFSRREQPEPAAEEYAPPAEEVDDSIFKPVIKLGAPDEEPAPEEQPEPEAEEIAEPEDAFEDEYTEEEPAEEAQPEESAEQPAKAAAAAAAAAVATTSQFATGQSLESFYADMSEDDILYRDCVEVWAADAKPAVLRLMKYVESIEDKHTAALFGRECEYINAMIDRIQCFTQLEYVDESLQMRKYNFAVLVKDCLKRFSPFFMEKRLGLLWKGLDIDVMTDRRWFIFALTQIIFNSVEFTPEGGKIAISAKRDGDFIDLMVDDSGKGISPDEMPYIFVAGYMGDDSPNEAGRRTGMGLFIAKSVINKMGGDVTAESNPGKGTRITLRLPVIEPEAQEA